MRTYQECVAAVAAVVAAIPGAGVVHDRTRFAADWGKYIQRFVDGSGVVNGWEITRRSADPQPTDWNETYVLRKFRALRDEDASEHAFQEQLNAVARAFRDAPELQLASGQPFGSVPLGLRIVEADERMFGAVLCHYAECELLVITDMDTL